MMRTGADEAFKPKYAHIERERRWLVDPRCRPDLSTLSFTLIEDRYITGTRLRLRRMTSETQSSLKLTKKYDASDPLARPIVTSYLTEAEYALFAALPADGITKRRYSCQGHSLDQFEGALAGLELAEREAADSAALRAIAAPLWTIREVSDDPRYQGGTLARLGKPEE